MQTKRGQVVGHTAISIGGKSLDIGIEFSERTQLSISVHPDMSISVRAPFGNSVEDVRYRVQKRSAWIIKQLHYFERFQPLPTKRLYESGETHLYLGRQYRLKVVTGSPESVKLKGRFLWVHTEDKHNRSRIKALVDRWYRDHAIVLLTRRLEAIVSSATSVRLPAPEVRFRKMSKRWGSCAKSDSITLNTELVKAPIHCIDYVIAHELCHLRYKNHTASFWRLLSRLMPDWEGRKLRLEEILI